MPQRGKDIIYLVQPINATVGSDALLPAFQTEGTWNREKELIDEQTKSGRAVAPGSKSENIDLTLFFENGDAGQNAIDDSYDNDQDIKVWRVNTKLNANGKHEARFSYAVIESIEMSEPTDGFVEMSTTLQIQNVSQKGEIDPLPSEVLEMAQYDFETPGETGKPTTP
ncbi:phage major tail protein, TP901-1 family [Bacillus capparidis]|uniref:TP901-1 family phage major tail protein n=1 Tax=Bacillus capparidis TaxID=1840411 RepID=A0ABS4CTZ0_9BACI|nr:phage major tail protein, TP901-1 family [Bacillus capparidis]MBP1080805.1 TP901-1 family phage major tail protein [Bacillus capparidis]MED1097449.1 phage major tail protein, TP901-1 family [Bacillus capparidis]